MKQLLVLLICCVLLLSACDENTPAKNTAKDDYAFDAQESDIGYQMSAHIAESEDSFYYMRDGFLYVIDKNSRKCMPLCSRPDCRHDQGGENHQGGCDAYFIHGEEIINYRNELYYLDEDSYIDNNGQQVQVMKFGKMQLDGTNRQDVFRTEDMMLWSFKIHRGKIYFLASPYHDDGSADSTGQMLYSLPVSGKGEPKVLLDMSGENRNYLDVRFSGDHLYLLEEVFISEAEQQYKLWRTDLNTGETEDLNEKLQNPVTSLFTIFNDKIVYVKDNSLYECSLDGSTVRQVADCTSYLEGFDWYSVKTCDGETLMLDACNNDRLEVRTWIFLDKEYKLVKTYHPSFNTIQANACNSEAMIVQEAMGTRLFYIDKTKIGDPACEQVVYEFKR